MTQVLQQHETFVAQAEQVLATDQPGWLKERRQQALARFMEAGFPTLEHEEWRFTDVRPLTGTRFADAPPAAARPARTDLAALDGGLRGPRLVFVDGRLAPALCDLAHLPAGLRVLDLDVALATQGNLLERHLARHADESDAFTALNTALASGGAVVLIDDDAQIDPVVRLVCLATRQPAPLALHSRNLIVAGPRSRATVVEHYLGPDGGVYWTNAVTEAVVAEDAHLAHFMVEEDSPEAFNISTLRVRQMARSRFESHTALFGGALVRNNVHVELAGPHCWSLVNGLFVGHGRQHMDNHMRVVHAAEHGDSRQFYKGVLSGQARGVFTGRIVVRPGAQKTDAKQTNRNLLLSDEAKVNARPQLEIYADDVKCTHGATTGRLDAAALFYLAARGVPPASARGLLIHAFAHESLGRMGLAPLRTRLSRLLLRKLPLGEQLEHTLEEEVAGISNSG